jgi:hypothetical protein
MDEDKDKKEDQAKPDDQEEAKEKDQQSKPVYKKPVLEKYDQIDRVRIYGID